MNYPLISEYIEAIRSAKDNFDKLTSLRPVLDNNGNPIMSSGNFAVVFKMKDVETEKYYAIKCFTKEQIKRKERYVKISEELKFVSSPYILNFKYMERELFVCKSGNDGEEFPVLVMDWVDGQTLDVYIKENQHDQYRLQILAYRFCKMGAWLLSQSFAHGDLKPDNILVRKDGSLVLVDYDGMYVPSMEGETASELGSPDFQHPLRTEKYFNEHIDDFSIASIALSLKTISLIPVFYNKYAAADRLLFSSADYRDIGKSNVFKIIMGMASNMELSTLISAFLLALSKNSLSIMSFRVFLLCKPEKPMIEVLSTEITDDEKANAITDEFGAKYTSDRFKLIQVPDNIETYTINRQTKVIGDYAFAWCTNLQYVNVPDDVICIGENAFLLCISLQYINIPDSVISIGRSAFSGCSFLQSINLPYRITSIEENTFSSCSSLKSIHIPDNVISIGRSAFNGCSSIKAINLPYKITSIEENTFYKCSSLQSINIPYKIKDIGNAIFCGCI